MRSRDDAAEDDRAGEHRFLRPDELLPDRRPDAVGGDDAVGRDALAARQADPVVVRLHDTRSEPKHAVGQRTHEHEMQIGTEEVELWRPEVLLGRVAVLRVEEQRAVVPTQQVHRFGAGRDGAQLFEQSEVVE